MDSTALGFEIIENDGCNYCKSFSSELELEYKDINYLLDTIKRGARKNKYDCIIGISGGLDSSYLLVKAKELGLNPLAVHMDNGWNSELAQSNISNLVKKLDVDLYTHVLDWQVFKKMQLAFLKADVIDIELLYDNAMLAVLYDQAAKNNIKYIIAGTNHKMEGLRMPLNWVWYKFDGQMIKSICDKFNTPYKGFPMMTLYKWIYYRKFRRIKWISLLDYIDFNKDEATDHLVNNFSYKKYPYKHYENVFTRFYQGFILYYKFKVDKRKLHLSNLILTNQLTREEGLKLISEIPYSPKNLEEDLSYVLAKFGISDKEFDEYMKREPQPHIKYKSDIKYLRKLLTISRKIGL
jgi:N-acetyl sugar amidotransferase